MQDRSTPKPRRFGMTQGQLAIVACLALIALGLIGFAGWTMFGGSLSGGLIPGFPAQQEAPATISLVTWTPGPTQAPTSVSTATPVPYEALIPEGWIQFKSGKVEVWMPATFKKTDPGDSLIAAIDTVQSESGFRPVVNLSKEIAAGKDMDAYIQDGLKNLPREMTYLERKKFTIGSYEAMRLRVETIIDDLPAESSIYLIKDGDTFWDITCTTYINDFYTWLPTFDKLARTFRLQP